MSDSSSNIILGDLKDTGINGGEFPNQQVSRKTKNTKKWKKDNIEFFINNRLGDSSVRKSKEEMRTNWNFYNSILSYEEMKLHLDPLGVEEDLMKEEDSTFTFYDILHQPLDTLFGEDLKRQQDLKAFAINANIVNAKDREFTQNISKYLEEVAKSESVNEEEFKKKLTEFDNYRKNDLQSAHEQMANQLLEVFSKTQYINAKIKFNTGFKNKEIVGETIFRVFHVGKEPNFKAVSSENFHVLGLGDSNWIEDGYAWIEEEYIHVHKIIDEFSEELTSSEVSKLLKLSSGKDSSLNPTQIQLVDTTIINDGNARSSETFPQAYIDDEDRVLMGNGEAGIINSDNNIRIYRVQWLSLRKIGKLKYYDKQGNAQYKWVDEYYTLLEDEGEEVKWIWVNELWEGVKIAEDIYKKVRAVPIQMRSLVNPSIVKPSYVGYINSNHGGKASCRLDRLKEYQRMYNVWMNKLNLLFVQNIGKAAVIDIAEIPSDMDHDEWYLWLKRFKIMFKNSFEQGKEGQARGLIAGNMQQGNKTIDLSLATEINVAIQTLSWIEQRVNSISAVPEPRQGAMTGKEGLGVSQQAIVSSSNQTEDSFFIHDILKAKTFTLLLEYTKYLWKDEKEVRQYVLDDLSNRFIDIDGALLNEAELGVIITNSSQLYEMYNNLKSLTHAAMQNGTVTLSDVAKMNMATSPAEMLNSLEVRI